MPLPFKRKIIKVGSTLGITIPKPFIDRFSLKKGNQVNLVSDALDYEDFIIIDLHGRDKKELLRILNEEEK